MAGAFGIWLIIGHGVTSLYRGVCLTIFGHAKMKIDSFLIEPTGLKMANVNAKPFVWDLFDYFYADINTEDDEISFRNARQIIQGMITDRNQLQQVQVKSRSQSDLEAHWIREANPPLTGKNSEHEYELTNN